MKVDIISLQKLTPAHSVRNGNTTLPYFYMTDAHGGNWFQ